MVRVTGKTSVEVNTSLLSEVEKVGEIMKNITSSISLSIGKVEDFRINIHLKKAKVNQDYNNSEKSE